METMKIKDVCDKTGLSSSTVRYYDSKGLLGDVRRGENNYRVFCDQDLNILNFIKQARELSFSLDEIQEILKLKEQGVAPCSYVNDRMNEKIDAIDKEIEQLKEEKATLQIHLVDAHKLTGCHGNVCHYIEGIDSLNLKEDDFAENNDCCSSNSNSDCCLPNEEQIEVLDCCSNSDCCDGEETSAIKDECKCSCYN